MEKTDNASDKEEEDDRQHFLYQCIIIIYAAVLYENVCIGLLDKPMHVCSGEGHVYHFTFPPNDEYQSIIYHLLKVQATVAILE